MANDQDAPQQPAPQAPQQDRNLIADGIVFYGHENFSRDVQMLQEFGLVDDATLATIQTTAEPARTIHSLASDFDELARVAKLNDKQQRDAAIRKIGHAVANDPTRRLNDELSDTEFGREYDRIYSKGRRP